MARRNRKSASRGAPAGRLRGALWLDALSRPSAAAALAALTLVVYANSLGGKFVFDDTAIVQGNRAIQGLDLDHLGEIFGGHYWKSVESRGGLYRPVVMLSYALNYALGGENPLGYHLVNVLLHAANAILLFLVIDALFGRRALSVVSAALFVLHPVRSEAVASVVGRAESLAAAFCLLAWLGYIRGRQSDDSRLLWPAAAAFALAALTKETSFAFLALLPLTDFLLSRGDPGLPASSRHAASRGTVPPATWFQPIPALRRWLPFLAALGLVLLLRYAVLGGLAPLYVNPSSNPLAAAGATTRFLTATHVFGRYLALLALPLALSADYSFNAVPLVQTLASTRALVPLGLLAALLAATVAAARRVPFLFFSGYLFFASFLLVSNWIRPIGTLMAERLLYLPSVGFTCAVAWLLVRGLDDRRWRAAAAVAAGAIALAYGVRTVGRNRDWHDHYALFRSAVEAAPGSSLAQANLATILLQERNDARGAITHAARAVEIYPGDPAAYFTLGEAHRRLGEFDAAARAFDEVVRRAPRTTGGVAALRGAIEAHEKSGRLADATAASERLIEWRPKDVGAHVALARLYRMTGQPSRAAETLERARALAPDDPAVAKALGEVVPR